MTALTETSFPRLRRQLQEDLVAGYDGLIARQAWDRPTLLRHQQHRLTALLDHAVARSRFHAERMAGVDVSGVPPDDLSALPVMTRDDLMDRFDDVVTDPAVTLDATEAALDGAGEEPAVVAGDALALVSGGSSGRRGVFVLDRAARAQYVGSVSRGLVARLRATGGPPGGLRIAMVAAASPVHATGMAAHATAGSALPFHFLPAPVTLPLDALVQRLQELRPHALYGYPSTLARLAAEQLAGRLRLRPAFVTCTAETLTGAQRSTIRAGFGAPVIDTFGSTEGLAGSSPPDDEAVVLAEDGCIVELVDERDRPVPVGTPSHAVLVTVLENRLQPLIRYRIDDSFVALPSHDGPGLLRVRVQGRSDPELDLAGTTVHPLALRTVLVHTPAVTDYQIRQTPTGIQADVVAPGGVDRAELTGRLRQALSAAGAGGADVAVAVVVDLPRDPRTGKARRVVPLG